MAIHKIAKRNNAWNFSNANNKFWEENLCDVKQQKNCTEQN
jgi:hypothetical protein